jgi:hypothetical protein
MQDTTNGRTVKRFIAGGTFITYSLSPVEAKTEKTI